MLLAFAMNLSQLVNILIRFFFILVFANRIDDSYRPVNLRKVVLGFPCAEKSSEFRFDLMLSYRLANVIQTYADLKPTLVVTAALLRVFQSRVT
jgi:hypothetical protein